MADYLLDWDATGADGSATFSSSTGGDDIAVTVSTPTNVNGDHFSLSSGVLSSNKVCNETKTIVNFDAAVENITFEVFDVDAGSGWDDKITIIARDEDGNIVPVSFSDLISHHQVNGNSVEGGGNYNTGVEGSGAPDTVTVSIAGPVVSIEIIHDDGDSSSLSGTVRISDIEFDAAPVILPDGYVDGTAGDDIIDVAYTGDPDGDMVDNDDAILADPNGPDLANSGDNDDWIRAGAGNDTVYAGDGNDLVMGGTGNDTIYGEDGDDALNGEAGNDTIYGDSGTSGTTVRESFEWDLAPDPGSPSSIDNGDNLEGGFTQNTGNVDVTFSVTNSSSNADTEFADNDQLVSGIVTDGGAADDNSSLYSVLNGSGNTSDYELGFSAEVEDVSFRINDVDGDGIVTVRAYDVGGNQITVNLTGGSDLTMLDTDGVAGNDTADSNGGYEPDTDAGYSVLVNIPGPVARIEIVHTQDGGNNSGINITDVFFDAPLAGIEGDDTISGGEGDDVIFGEGGDDTITGGAGADTISGGAGRDTIIGGNAGDTVDGGTEGDDNDTLDLSADGPLRVINQTVDADGDSTSGTIEFLDSDGNVTGSMTFTEIETLILPPNTGPTAGDDNYDVEEDGSVTFNPLLNDTDPEGDTLTLVGASDPAHGSITDNGDGTYTYTPDADYNGPDSFSYAVTDGNGNTDTATVTFNVTPVNDAPDAVDDTATTDEDTAVTIDVLSNDTDVDGDTLAIVGTPTALHGTVSVNADGTLEYTPDADYNGDDTITYVVSDGNGGTDTGQVAVTVAPINDDPVANDDTGVTDYETPVTIDVLANDTDVDGDTLAVQGTPTSANGTVAVNPDGTITFTPDAGFEGDAVITYDVTDGNGGTDTGTVTVTVGANPQDGIVSGTAGDDLIDYDYTGDPEGDLVDHEDEILPGEGLNDDIILAGDGNDTVEAGAGDDEVYGDAGDDVIDGGTGDDYLSGGEGDDIIHGGDGDDTLDAGQGSDQLFGEDGNDTLLGGPGTDLMDGGAGDDTIIGGNSHDTIIGGDGSDTVHGNDGNDVIDTSGSDPQPDVAYPGLYPADLDPNNDIDTVYGGAGDDTISTGDDADYIDGGTGDDTIDGGIDDDTIDGGDGNDTIIGGEGSDIIDGGTGDDVIYGGLDPSFPDALNIPDDGSGPYGPDLVPTNGMDVIHGGDGNDTIYGADDDDTLFGDAGNDTIDGGIDDDTIDGGSGDDTLIGGQGDDTITGGTGDDSIDGGSGSDIMSGGDDQDTFSNITAGDVVDGGEGGVDNDTLDLTGSRPVDGTIRVIYDAGNPENGHVDFRDADGNVINTMEFSNIENVIPCFTPGTLIATPKGERLVEELREGDKIITRDNGIQEIRWVGEKKLGWKDLAANPHLKPILIQKGSLGNDLPERDMMVSPNHRMLVANDKTMLYFEEREVLAAAKHLVNNSGVHTIESLGTSYLHFMFDNHEVVLSDGTWTESFQPGDYTLQGIGNAQRAEILELFPELATAQGIKDYQSARKTLKAHETRLLAK